MDDLITAIKDLHGCDAAYNESTEIHEEFEGQPVWQGEVHTFTIEGHPDTDTCYAWSSPIEGSSKRKFYAVLKISPVDTPEAAVRASIVSDNRNEESNQ